MDRIKEELRKVALDRLRPLHRHPVTQGVVAAASILVRAAQRGVARYRQSRLTNLPREKVTNAGPHCVVSVETKDPTGGIDLQSPPIRNGRCSLQKQDSSVLQCIHGHDRQQFHADGYMVIRNVVPPSLVGNAAREIAAFVNADLADSTTWYRGPLELDGIVPMHHAQSLWDIRQSPNLYQIFTEFFGTPRLIVDINRCIFRPPVHRRFPKISRGSVHWDTDPRGPRPPSLQAVVLLSDVGHDGGGFQCLPDVYQNLDAWLKRYARRDDFDFFYPGLNHWKTIQVGGKAGDVILWSTRLPHGSAINLSNRPRVAAFVSMQPCGDNSQLREWMKNWWLTKRAPDYWRDLPGQLDPEPGAPAVLSDLGLKLIGVSPW
jgi:Phytanoyl-CoA dioxygenase (PhyH)